MKMLIVFLLSLSACLAATAQNYDLPIAAELDLGVPLGQLRAVPVNIGNDRPKAIAAMYSEDTEIDPYTGMFFFPQHTLKIVMFDEYGKELWEKDLGKGYFEGDGTVLDAKGSVLGNIGGLSAMASKFTGLPGEQILSYSKEGIVRIWADRNAKDNEKAVARYKNPFYKVNQKQTGNGYNLFTLGGI